MTHRVLAQVYCTVSPVGPWIHSVVIPQVLECIMETALLSHWQSPHSGSLTHEVRATKVEKVECKSSGLPLSMKIVNQKQ